MAVLPECCIQRFYVQNQVKWWAKPWCFLHFAHFFGRESTLRCYKKAPCSLDLLTQKSMRQLRSLVSIGISVYLWVLSANTYHDTRQSDKFNVDLGGVICWWCEHHLVLFLWCLKRENGGEQVLFEGYPHHKIRSWIDARSVSMGVVKNQPLFLRLATLGLVLHYINPFYFVVHELHRFILSHTRTDILVELYLL